MMNDEDKLKVDLALKMSKYIHDNCKDVPHDIGMKLIEIIERYSKEYFEKKKLRGDL